MSDPARDGYQCHGAMQPVGYLGEAAVHGYVCIVCGVTKNVVRGNAVLRSRVDDALYEIARQIGQIDKRLIIN